MSSPINPDASYWVFVRLSQRSFPVSFEATDESNQKATKIDAKVIQPLEGESSEQLVVLNDVPTYGDETTFLRIGIPEQKGNANPESIRVGSVAIGPFGEFKNSTAALMSLRGRVAVVVPSWLRPLGNNSDRRVQLVYCFDNEFCAKPIIRTVVHDKWQTVWEQPWTPHKGTSYAIPWKPLRNEKLLEPGSYHFVVKLSDHNSCVQLNKQRLPGKERIIETWFRIQDPKKK